MTLHHITCITCHYMQTMMLMPWTPWLPRPPGVTTTHAVTCRSADSHDSDSALRVRLTQRRPGVTGGGKYVLWRELNILYPARLCKNPRLASAPVAALARALAEDRRGRRRRPSPWHLRALVLVSYKLEQPDFKLNFQVWIRRRMLDC